ncbi:hypothetical protein J2D73_11585 [Acetobacter sacchari]|uniref:Uncharacterized protein n=1 Tax=Acetobacter sacchari TaxID=2661687 RepID=A0ABS3LX05_9PROT|nr:hypothetical protein [Acetobacter sacchari]MBO1360429.1 hypothetical protein [Acetobacter sacchari]
MKIDTALGTSGMVAQDSAAAIQSGKTNKNAAYNRNLEQGLDTLQHDDPKLFAEIMTDGQSGNGNKLVEDELKAYKERVLTKDQAIAAVSGAQSLANQNGGGKVNGHVRDDAEDALGGTYIKGGQTRATHGFLKFIESSSPLWQMVKGIKSKTSDGMAKENILQAGQGALQSGVQQAMSDLDRTDPEAAEQFAKDARSKDGNAMAEDLVALGQEEQQYGDGSFSDADAAMLGSQIGGIGEGKVSSKDNQTFEAEYGQGTIDRGSTSASKGWSKFEADVANFMGSLVSPLTNGVGAIDQFAKGNAKAGLCDLGGVLTGIASDAALIVAPEAAPELDVAETAARAGTEATEAASKSSTESIMNTILNRASKAYDVLDYGSNLYGMVSSNGSTENGSDRT